MAILRTDFEEIRALILNFSLVTAQFGSDAARIMNDRTNSAINPKFYQLSLILLILVGIFLRFYDLESRPVHHDESLHGTYARYAVENPESSFYHYDPMLHGPLLYNCVAWLFSTFGISTFVLRSLNAGLGSLFLFTPLLFRRFISPSALIWSTAALSLSPSLIYWSRFAHHDYLILASYTLLACGVLLAKAPLGIILCFVSFALQYSIKANIFVFAALLLGFLIFELISTRLISRNQECYLYKICKTLSLNKVPTAVGILLASILFSALYSGNFRDSTGILDGLYRKVFAYWIEQHHMQRLDGPFSFHLLVLSLYELPLLLAFLAALLLAIFGLPRNMRILLAFLSAIFAIASFSISQNLYNGGVLSTYLKVKSPFDLLVNLELAVLAILLPLDFLKKNQRALSFFCYLSLATLWTYSFLGEKVPWLTIYPQVSGLIFVILLLDSLKLFERDYLSLIKPVSLVRTFAVLSCVVMGATTICIIEGLLLKDLGSISANTLRLLGWSFGFLLTFITFRALKIDTKVPAIAFSLFLSISLYTSILTNFTRAGDKRELLSQVHTNYESHKLFLSLRDHLANPLNKTEPKILVSGSSVWPATWYFRNLPGYNFTADKSQYTEFDYLVVEETDHGVDENFNTQMIPLQSWWVPDYSKLRLKALLTYYFTHEPWSTPGSLQVKFAIPVESKEEEAALSAADDEELTEETADEEIGEEIKSEIDPPDSFMENKP